MIRFNIALSGAKTELASLDNKVTDAEAIKREDWARIACTYAAIYSGDNTFMVAMRDSWKQHKSLTTAQIRGILNVIRHSAREESRATREQTGSVNSVIVPAAQEIRNGYYTVSFEDGTHTTIRVTKGAKKGRQNVSYLCGSVNDRDYRYFASVFGVRVYPKYGYEKPNAALKVLMSADATTLTAFGRAYAQESGNCYICGRLLTDPESISSGIGPICAGKQ